MKERPEAAKRYQVEEEELVEMMHRYRFAPTLSEPAHQKEILTWLDKTLYTHREEAYAEGLKSWGRPTGWKGWWERNWFPLALLALIGGGSVLIGLVNGWS